MWSERSLCGSYISAVYTRIHIHAYVCEDQPLKRKRHFFRCAANKEIWHLEAIRRAVIFDVDFVTNGGQDGHCATCISAVCTHTFTYMHICVQISYKRHFLRIRHMAPGSYSQSYSANSLVSGKIFTRITVDKYYRDTGVTVCACMRFACVIRSGYLVLANQHTSSEGQGSRDLRQTRVEPYWIEIVGHSSTKHQFSLPLRIFNRL